MVRYALFLGMNMELADRNTELPYKSPLQPYVSWATLVMVSLVVFFSGLCFPQLQIRCRQDQGSSDIRPGFDIFVKGQFTASGFITCYINIFIFAGKFNPSNVDRAK